MGVFEYKEINLKNIHWKPESVILKWCGLPYRNHPKGCPNTGTCNYYIQGLKRKLAKHSRLFLAWIEFDIDQHERLMRERHPKWSRLQLRNLLYWQSSMKKLLRDNIRKKFPGATAYYNAEGGGVNFYKTMRDIGIELDIPSDLHCVRLIAIIGKSKSLLDW
jgi:hypothetical protein